MAAPNGIIWGDVVGGYGRIGIYVKLTNTSTQTTRHTEIWFWSKYSVSDTTNTLYYDDNATSASTSRGSISINTTSDSGGWSTTNQIKLKEYNDTFNRGTSSSTRNVAASLSGINAVGGTMTATTSYTIPALTAVTCTITYNANGGSGAPSSHSYTYASSGVTYLSSTIPSRTGYTFLGWSLSPTATSASYSAGQAWGLSNKDDYVLYAVWKEVPIYTNKIKHWRYVGTGGNNSTGTMYCADDDSTFTATYGTTTTIPSNLVKSYRGYYNNGTAGGKWDGSNFTQKSIGSTFTQPASGLSIEYYYYPNEYTIHFDGNGATSGNTASMIMAYDKEAALSANGFIRDNYYFIGWATSPNGSVIYLDSAVVKNLSDYADVTLYAVWEHVLFNNHTKAYIKTKNGVKPHKLMVFDGTTWVHYKSKIGNN